MKTTEASASTPAQQALPGDPLRVLVEHVRDHPRIDAAVLAIIDPGGQDVEPVAWWFASPIVERVVAPHLQHSFNVIRATLVETVLDRAKPLFLQRVDSWEAAAPLQAQIELDAVEGFGSDAWGALGQASLIACPVRTPLGRATGLLVVASLDPARPLERGDVAVVSVLADLLARVRERVDLAVAEAAHERRESLLKRAAEEAAASLEIPDVQHRVVAHALELVAADRAVLSPANGRGVAASAGGAVTVDPAAGTVADVARSRRPLLEGHTAHVPVALGPRLFGVLSVTRLSGERFTDDDVEALGRLARGSAAAMANAVDFDRERRIARALTRGFVPESLPELAGWEVGLLYEPAAHQAAGGDVYGVWEIPGAGVAVLIGDVAGKGVETAALSAMTRFFIEARSWDCRSPAQILQQANLLLRDRLPRDTFVTAFLGMIDPSGLRYANAGHLRPLIFGSGGSVAEAAGRDLPLGIERDAAYEDHALPLGAGDALLGFTDGLVEARRSDELFGERRLRETAAKAASGGMQELVTAVHRSAKEFAGALQDDAVLLALRRR